MSVRTNTSIIGSLVREISGEGRRVLRYHENGGLGDENVPTAEVLQGLYFLPRSHFFGAVISELEGDVLSVKGKLLTEIEDEDTSVSMLSERFYLRPSEKSHARQGEVRPDGLLKSKSVFCLIEGKKMGPSSFGPEQLAREFVIVTREAKSRLPLLLLILGEKPPVSVKGAGRQAVRDAILDKLEGVRGKTEDHPYSYSELRDMVDASVAWITWKRVSEVVDRQMQTFAVESKSVHASIQRLADAVTDAIDHHALPGF